MDDYVVIGIVSLTLVRYDLSVLLLKTALPDWPYQTVPTRLALLDYPTRILTKLSLQTVPARMSLPDCPCQTNLMV